jgi:hypothetical protein
VADLGVVCIKIFLSSCSNLLFRFLTKKIHEKMPTVRMSNAAAAIVMPAIWAMVRFSSPDTLTPSEPVLTDAFDTVVVVVDIAGGVVVMKDIVLEINVCVVVEVGAAGGTEEI